MKDNPTNELKKVKRELSNCRRELKETQAFNERLRSSIGYDELKGWKPQERIEIQYGWVFAWLYPLSTYMNQNLNKTFSPEIRNKIHEIVTAIIAQLAVNGKYGIKLPNDPRPVDTTLFEMKQADENRLVYDPCIICGESRITHTCHIIPHSEGGPNHRDNFVTLCPLHHHLFDHARLTEKEWETFMISTEEKMEAAILYSSTIRLAALQTYWKTKM